MLLDERLSWLVLHIEAPLLEYAQRNPSFFDRDAVLALEYTRDKVQKRRSRLLLAGEKDQVQNEIGEAILLSLEQCRFQKKIILLQDAERYTSEERLKCLDNVILRIKYLAGKDIAGRNYLQDLSQRLDQLRKLSAQKKIITPP